MVSRYGVGSADAEMAQIRAEDELLYQLARGEARGWLQLGEAAARFADRDGAQRLGFSTRDAYARQQLSRTGRAVDDAARLARRLEKQPLVRAGFLEGRINPCMVDLIARKIAAQPELEAELVDIALTPGITVQAMRDYLNDDGASAGEDCGGSEKCDVIETVPAEVATLVEATRMLIEHLNGGGSDPDWFECMVGEGCSMWPELFNGEIMPEVGEDLAALREGMAAGKDRAREREELAEPHLPVNEPERGDFPDAEPLPETPSELDAHMQRISMRLASRDLILGRVASDFFRKSKWNRLGYASDKQYCVERLGRKRSWVWNRITLARRCESLPLLAEAVMTMRVGFESALVLSRVATRETEAAWIERAGRRTYKHLREEVQAVEADARIAPGARGAPWPPSEEEMGRYHDFERAVLSGELVEQLADGELPVDPEIWIGGDGAEEEGKEEASDSIQISASPFGVDPPSIARRLAAMIERRRGRRHTKGEVTMRFRTHVETAAMYRAARVRYRRLGEPHTLIVALCVWTWSTWYAPLRAALSKYDHIHRRDRLVCASPGCFRKLLTIHHIVMRMLGGDDRWENLLTLCDRCHLQNIHENGSLAVTGAAPSWLTFVFGKEPIFVVRGREMRWVAA